MEQLDGDVALQNVFVIIEFLSKEAAEPFYKDPEYKLHLDNRIAGSDSEFTLMADEELTAA